MADTAIVTGTPAAAPGEIDSTSDTLVDHGLEALAAYDRFTQEQIEEIAEPVGVVCAVTPVTNPTSTTIFKALLDDMQDIMRAAHYGK